MEKPKIFLSPEQQEHYFLGGELKKAMFMSKHIGEIILQNNKDKILSKRVEYLSELEQEWQRRVFYRNEETGLFVSDETGLELVYGPENLIKVTSNADITDKLFHSVNELDRTIHSPKLFDLFSYAQNTFNRKISPNDLSFNWKQTEHAFGYSYDLNYLEQMAFINIEGSKKAKKWLSFEETNKGVDIQTEFIKKLKFEGLIRKNEDGLHYLTNRAKECLFKHYAK